MQMLHGNRGFAFAICNRTVDFPKRIEPKWQRLPHFSNTRPLFAWTTHDDQSAHVNYHASFVSVPESAPANIDPSISDGIVIFFMQSISGVNSHEQRFFIR